MDNFVDRCFTMMRLNGPYRPIGVLIPCLRFNADGTTKGSGHPNESRWEVQDNGNIIFLKHPEGHVTTRFEKVSESKWSGFLVGTEIVHELIRNEPSATDKKKFEVVIAKYKEDISWSSSFANLCTVYCKGPEVEPGEIKLPNIGREAHTYLTHIVDRYDSLAERTMFLQGHPYDHFLSSWYKYEDTSKPFYSNVAAKKKLDHTGGWYSTAEPGKPLEMWIISKKLMDAFFQEYLGHGYDKDTLYYSYGAQFSVSREKILEKPRGYYAKLLYFCSQYPEFTLGGETWHNYLTAVIFEMTWQEDFQMKLIYATTPSHEVLRDTIFLPSLREPWEIIELQLKSEGTGDFNTHDWLNAVYNKVIKVEEIIRRYDGEIVVVADVDIQWFKPCQDRIVAALNGFDIVFQKESGKLSEKRYVNLGFFAVRCSAKMAAIFAETIIAIEKENINDQIYINRLIEKNKLSSWNFLPNQFLNDDIEMENKMCYKDIVLYHSTWTFPKPGKSSIDIKLEKHKQMTRKVMEAQSS